jgi:hypothetical protein
MRIGKLLLFSVMGLISCQPQDICDDFTQSELTVVFKKVDSDPVADTTFSGVYLFGINEGNDLSLLYDSVDASRIVLPLDPGHRVSRFVFSIYEQSDTLEILHSNEHYLISYSCGFSTRFTLEQVDHSQLVIKGYEIIDPVVENETEFSEEHLWLYF